VLRGDVQARMPEGRYPANRNNLVIATIARLLPVGKKATRPTFEARMLDACQFAVTRARSEGCGHDPGLTNTGFAANATS
jgi:hypothetical protein